MAVQKVLALIAAPAAAEVEVVLEEMARAEVTVVEKATRMISSTAPTVFQGEPYRIVA